MRMLAEFFPEFAENWMKSMHFMNRREQLMRRHISSSVLLFQSKADRSLVY